ncbi:MAG: hypothetical protein RLZZ338_1821 [Cyanobacteriota bacterium]|jgi:hypothetical protein
MRIILIFSLIFTLFFAVVNPAIASFCRQLNGHLICIVSIERSAKNYWEYPTVISVDGIEKPREIYNCRNQTKTQNNGKIVSFESDGVGELICRILK